MPFWNKFPYTDFHELNLDWIINKIIYTLQKVQEINDKVDNFIVDTAPRKIREVINKWLDEHPEATTTVQDGAIDINKLSNSLKTNFSAYAFPYGNSGADGIEWQKLFVTPEMYGAIGDGITDDSIAIQSAINSRYPVYFENTYFISSTLNIEDSNIMLVGAKNASIISEGNTILHIGNLTSIINNVYIFNILFSCRHLSNAINIAGNRVNKLYIYNCVFDNFTSYGINVSCATGYNYVEKCRFYSAEANTNYINFGVSNTTIPLNYWFIKDNAFEFGTGANEGINKNAIYMESGVIVEIDNNDFANWNSGNCINLSPTKNLTNIKITGNNFYNIGDSNCIYITRDSTTATIYDIDISNNYFTSQSRTGACVVNTEDAQYTINDIVLGENKIRGRWSKLYNMNHINNIYLSPLVRVESGSNLPALSSLCTYNNTANVHPPVIKSYFSYATINAGESTTLNIELKNIPYTLQSYNPVLYINHSTGTGAIISGLTYDNATGIITVTVTNNSQGARPIRVSII